eukprot:GFUD01044604.1.p1 GENE.GFUD01044604.1~~GFUD01044604.1.p1  ORF type:complete len:319 (-),score=100.70 GFUD01044604.1:60-929(-)
MKEKMSKKQKLSKYRRKTANAKERERMKKMNEVFVSLKNVIPDRNVDDIEDEKETKVTTLKSAIAYINCLKKLIEDCDAGLVDKKMFSSKEMKASKGKENIASDTSTKATKEKAEKDKTPKERRVKTSKPVILDPKWTNYSEQFLESKFCLPKSGNLVQSEYPSPDMSTMPAQPADIRQHAYLPLMGGETVSSHPYQDCRGINLNLPQMAELHPLPGINTFTLHLQEEKCPSYSSPTSSCSSPRDVNEISLHISLIGNSASTRQEEEGDDNVHSLINSQEEFNCCDYCL